MPQIHQHISSASALAVHWRVLGMMAVLFARRILRLEMSNPRTALHHAQKVEMWVHAAQGVLSQQISRLPADAEVRSPKEARAFQYLHVTASALRALALFVTQLKQRLEEKLEAARHIADTTDSIGRRSFRLAYRAPYAQPAFIDTG